MAVMQSFAAADSGAGRPVSVPKTGDRPDGGLRMCRPYAAAGRVRRYASSFLKPREHASEACVRGSILPQMLLAGVGEGGLTHCVASCRELQMSREN
jgi:hypothetical protein